jgi:carbon storage regulator CsrA
MLVLSRKVGDRIVIGSQIHLTVTEIRGGGVRVAIQAPRDVVILRGELTPWADPGAEPVVPPPPSRPRPPRPCPTGRS